MQASRPGYNPLYSEQEPSIETISGLSNMAILEFGAPWCSHCQNAQAAIEEVLAKQPELPHIKIYDGKNMRLGRNFGVKLWPTLILLQEGKEVARTVRPLRIDDLYELLNHIGQ